VTNWFVNNHLRYEKRNDTECCIIRRGSDVRFVLELDAGGDHNHDASNHGYDGSTATYYWRADNDNNDARRNRRLLIAKAGRGRVCCRHDYLRAVSVFLKAALNSIGHKPVATVENGAQDFCAGGSALWACSSSI
jgi:hypothetical protein